MKFPGIHVYGPNHRNNQDNAAPGTPRPHLRIFGTDIRLGRRPVNSQPPAPRQELDHAIRNWQQSVPSGDTVIRPASPANWVDSQEVAPADEPARARSADAIQRARLARNLASINEILGSPQQPGSIRALPAELQVEPLAALYRSAWKVGNALERDRSLDAVDAAARELPFSNQIEYFRRQTEIIAAS
jgi:hypothetical protein